jgi:hypothetical protein
LRLNLKKVVLKRTTMLEQTSGRTFARYSGWPFEILMML